MEQSDLYFWNLMVISKFETKEQTAHQRRLFDFFKQKNDEGMKQGSGTGTGVEETGISAVGPWPTQVWIMWVHLYADFFQ